MAIPGPLTLGKGPFPLYNPGRQLIQGEDFNQISGAFSSSSGNTAHAGGGITLAYMINAAFVQFSVVATGGDSCVLPKAYPGLEITIQNDGAASLQVFANGTDTINGTAGATGVALANGATALYSCVLVGQWKRFVSA
jgi:hypothetical protein